jgi:hypothetical protein
MDGEGCATGTMCPRGNTRLQKLHDQGQRFLGDAARLKYWSEKLWMSRVELRNSVQADGPMT